MKRTISGSSVHFRRPNGPAQLEAAGAEQRRCLAVALLSCGKTDPGETVAHERPLLTSAP